VGDLACQKGFESGGKLDFFLIVAFSARWQDGTPAYGRCISIKQHFCIYPAY
jgi:hypothetical protein